jgi:endonuclease G, mitochondrial
MIRLASIWIFLFVIVSISAQKYIPQSGGELIEHSYFSLAFSDNHKQAKWVYYELKPEFIVGSESRSDNFRPDPKVSTGSAQLIDYRGSGYDRGHLCPAADMKHCPVAMSETFYMSNMSPQHPSFNRGIWSRLEELVRSWAMHYEGIHVVTGPVFYENIGAIGPNNVTVPGHYYKVVYVPTEPPKMIGLVLPNKAGERQLHEYVITVDSIESLTGIDFFPQLPSVIQEQLESRICIEGFYFTTAGRPVQSNTTTDVVKPQSQSQQCKGIAKSTNQRCRNVTRNPNGYCHHHQNQVR